MLRADAPAAIGASRGRAALPLWRGRAAGQGPPEDSANGPSTGAPEAAAAAAAVACSRRAAALLRRCPLAASGRHWRRRLLRPRLARRASGPAGFDLRATIDAVPGRLPEEDPALALPELPRGQERGPSRTIVVGGGPGGLAAALALARRGWTGIEVWERLEPPPDPDDAQAWGEPARSYHLGLSGRGQTSLALLGAWRAVSLRCARVAGRFDWAPGSAEGVVTEAVRNYPTMVIQRDRLVGALLEELRTKHAGAVTVQHGVECAGIETAPSGATQLVRRQGGGEARVTAEFVIAADGVNSTLTRAMSDMAPQGGFGVTRLEPNKDRELVYKPLKLESSRIPSGWRRDLNYSARSGEDLATAVTLEALPTREGDLIAVLLFPPSDARLTELSRSAEDARRRVGDLFPQFVGCVADSEWASFAARPASRLPAFAFAGPQLHVAAPGATFVALGDSVHCVKPYFGLGVNSAFEDVICLTRSLDAAGAGKLQAAAQRYSDARGKEAEALTRMSASFDGSILEFVVPLVLDGIFSSLLPQIFSVNAIRMLQNEEYSFTEVAAIKRRDRLLQAVVVLLALAAALAGGSSLYGLLFAA